MKENLFNENTPKKFWKLLTPIEDEVWNTAISLSLEELQYPVHNLSGFLQWSLGEESYNGGNWDLPFLKKIYYHLKPLIPQSISKRIRAAISRFGSSNQAHHEHWPIDKRYVDFQYRVVSKVMDLQSCTSFEFLNFWPNHRQSAFILTHDIETASGQQFAIQVAKIEQSLGFRSCFYFILDRYPVDLDVIRELTSMGCSIGIHGLKHDGKLFFSDKITQKRMAIINEGIVKLDANSFRSPLTLRNPEKLQLLDAVCDLSFFDTDPYEPMPGGVMSIWPFQMGRLMELPYTLDQDYTLFEILGHHNPNAWFEKMDWIKSAHGMILLDTHPDYLINQKNMEMYKSFLIQAQKESETLWFALPHEVAAWWNFRSEAQGEDDTVGLKKSILQKGKDAEIIVMVD